MSHHDELSSGLFWHKGVRPGSYEEPATLGERIVSGLCSDDALADCVTDTMC
jgi:hypothetical protein